MGDGQETKNLPAVTGSSLLASLEQAISAQGISADTIASMLKELCNWKTMKIDKNGNVHEFIDGELRLKAISLLLKVAGKLDAKESGDEIHNHLHLERLPDGKLNELSRKIKQS